MRAAQTVIKNFYKRNFSILIFFSAARMSVCAAAPSPCLPLEKSANFVLKFRLIAETSNRLNVYPVFVTFRRFVYSAMRRNDGRAFRRQNVSATTFFAVSSARCGRNGEIIRCDARIGGSASYPNRRIAEKRENRRKSPKRRQDRDAWKMF